MGVKASSQVTVVDVTDAYSVILTSEAYTFVGNDIGAPSGLSCTTQVIAYRGSDLCPKVTIGTIRCPAGISATISNNNSSSPTIKFNTTATVSSAREAIIQVTVDDVTINKKFSFSVAKKGKKGNGIKSITRYYYLSSGTPSKPNTNPPTSSWTIAEPSYTSGSNDSLYFVDCYVFTDNSFQYSEVCKSSSYEAAKDAWIKAQMTDERVDETNDRVNQAESIIQQLNNSISMLVTDGNGGSLMTQTEHGWTFNMQKTNDAMSNLSSSLSELQNTTGNTQSTVNVLQKTLTDHGQILEYVNISTYEGEPCIELGENHSDFKLRITNTRIMFLSGSNIPTYINTNGLVTQNIEVTGEIVHGGYTMMNTSDGGWGLIWKGASS